MTHPAHHGPLMTYTEVVVILSTISVMGIFAGLCLLLNALFGWQTIAEKTPYKQICGFASKLSSIGMFCFILELLYIAWKVVCG